MPSGPLFFCLTVEGYPVERNESLLNLKGIGPKTYAALNQLGLFSADDMLRYYPRSYKEYGAPVSYEDLQDQYFCTVAGTIKGRPILRRGKRADLVIARLETNTKSIQLNWFNMPYLVSALKPGRRVLVHGRARKRGNGWSIDQAEVFSEEEYARRQGSLQPVYRTGKGVSNNLLQKHIRQLISETEDRDDPFYAVAKEAGVELPPGRIEQNIHFPENYDIYKSARSFLAFQEFLTFMLQMRFGMSNSPAYPNCLPSFDRQAVDRALKALPYTLTEDQTDVLETILSDMSSPHAMSRLVQGDVGSGKTVLAFMALIFAACNGSQAVMMAPTEVLARQHYEKFIRFLEQSGLSIETALLVGSLKEKEKKAVHEGTSDGSIRIVIGTNAVIQEKAVYRNLGLVVTDEQHRFGVGQRRSLFEKGMCPHVLVMSATPIPRTLAMILYGDLEISRITQMPVGRLPIKNCMLKEKDRLKAHRFLLNEVQKGHQGYVICPLIDESEAMSGENVSAYGKLLKEEMGDRARIAVLHGQMSPKEKNRVMEDFAENRIDLLVSTTVIEVGVDVANATVMLIENADMFGLAALHQLRGRVGRGKDQSYCIFMNASGRKEAEDRLNMLVNSNDGFAIADADLKNRGPGEFFGQMQSGAFHFQIGDIYEDADVLRKADEACRKILKKDPDLVLEENGFLRERIALSSEAKFTI